MSPKFQFFILKKLLIKFIQAMEIEILILLRLNL